MDQASRHQKILEMLSASGFVSIDELVDHFKVTPQTIRRDINDLASQNKLRRLRGGATMDSSTINTAYSTRKHLLLQEKHEIAEAVAAAIPDHSSLFINIGTTTESIAHALMNHQGLQVITNNLNVAAIMSPKEDFNVIIAGGTIRSRDGGVVGEATIDFINQFKVDYGIIGISAIDSDGSLLDFDYHEVRVAQAIIDNSRQVFLASDHSKFGRTATVRLGNISQVDTFFTDQEPPKPLARLMRDHEVTIEIAHKA